MNKKDYDRIMALIEKKRRHFEEIHRAFYDELTYFSKTGKNKEKPEEFSGRKLKNKKRQ